MSSNRPSSGTSTGETVEPERTGDPLRLLVAVPYGPRFDNMHGGRVIAQLLSRLVDRHRVAIVYMTEPGAPPIDPALSSRCEVVKRIQLRGSRRLPARWHYGLQVLSTPLTGRPSPVAARFSPRFADAVRELTLRWRPDVIQIDHDLLAYCAPRLRGLAPRLLVCHDPGLGASEDMASLAAGHRRLIHRLDAAVWRRHGPRMLAEFEALIAFTDSDVRALRELAPATQTFCVPIGLDLPADPCSPTGSGEPSVVFIGGYLHPPNADAAVRLITSIMPAVRRRIPGLRMMLVGDKPTDQMRRLAGADDVITGPVATVTPFLDEASVVAIPIRIGGGMRVKLLDALAAGKAVVASPRAASGLEVNNGRELLLADNDDDFVRAIVELVEDETSRSALARGAREWAARNLRWEPRVRQYEEIYRRVAAGGAGQRDGPPSSATKRDVAVPASLPEPCASTTDAATPASPSGSS